MTVIASVDVGAVEFALGRTFEAIPPDVTVEAEPVVPLSTTVLPYYWVETAGGRVSLSALRDASRVASVTCLEKLDRRHLLRVEWTDEPDELCPVLVDSAAAVLEARRRDGIWTFRLRFPSAEELSAFNRRCQAEGIDVGLRQVTRSPDESEHPRYGLTPEQREVLVQAADAGYFEVPRETTLTDLGEELNISDSAASQRLRRGLATLLTETILRDR